MVEEEEERQQRTMVDALYDHLVSSVCIDMAANLHGLLKTGHIPLNELREPSHRLEIYGDLYESTNDDEQTPQLKVDEKGTLPASVQAQLDRYATETVSRMTPSSSSSLTSSNRQLHNKRKRQDKKQGGSTTKEDPDDDEEDEDDDADNDEDDEDFKIEDEPAEEEDSDEESSKKKNAKGDARTRKTATTEKEGAAATTRTSGIGADTEMTDVDDAANNIHTSSSVLPAATTATSQQQQQIHQNAVGLDIWGRYPPKEPKQTALCRLCGRHVSTMRFASHLDKCMGLSTARGVTPPASGIHHTGIGAGMLTGSAAALLSSSSTGGGAGASSHHRTT